MYTVSASSPFVVFHPWPLAGKSRAELESLTVGVKTVVEKRLPDEQGRGGLRTESEYDRQGNLLIQKEYSEGVLRATAVLAYDKAGRLEKESRADPKGQSAATVYAYGPDNRLKRVDVLGDGKLRYHLAYTYAEGGRVVREDQIDGDDNALIGRQVYRYDERGNILESVNEGRLARTTTYAYDGKGNLMGRRSLVSPIGSLFSRKATLYATEYDSALRVTRSDSVDEGDTPFKAEGGWYRHDYKLDPRGNWVREEVYQTDSGKGRLVSVHTRDITYHPR